MENFFQAEAFLNNYYFLTSGKSVFFEQRYCGPVLAIELFAVQVLQNNPKLCTV